MCYVIYIDSPEVDFNLLYKKYWIIIIEIKQSCIIYNEKLPLLYHLFLLVAWSSTRLLMFTLGFMPRHKCLFVCPQMINPNNLQKISFCESESWWAFKWLFFGLGFSLFYTDWHDLSLSLFCTISCSKQNWYIKQILSVLLLGGAIVKTILLSDLDILPSRAVNIPEANNDQKLGSYDLDFHLWSDEK